MWSGGLEHRQTLAVYFGSNPTITNSKNNIISLILTALLMLINHTPRPDMQTSFLGTSHSLTWNPPNDNPFLSTILLS
jgi:hypothetical protein